MKASLGQFGFVRIFGPAIYGSLNLREELFGFRLRDRRVLGDLQDVLLGRIRIGPPAGARTNWLSSACQTQNLEPDLE